MLSLDYLIERPTLGWLPTEADKVRRFEALGIDRGTCCRTGNMVQGEKGQPRYFALKLPIAIDERAATFVYVDAGQSTDSELRAWGVAHAPLWAALRARTFAVHVVAVGTGVDGRGTRRARPETLDAGRRRPGRGGPGRADQGRPGHPPGNRPASDGDYGMGNRELLRAAGGWEKAADRLEWLQHLPDGTPTKATARERRLTASRSGPPSG